MASKPGMKTYTDAEFTIKLSSGRWQTHVGEIRVSFNGQSMVLHCYDIGCRTSYHVRAMHCRPASLANQLGKLGAYIRACERAGRMLTEADCPDLSVSYVKKRRKVVKK